MVVMIMVVIMVMMVVVMVIMTVIVVSSAPPALQSLAIGFGACGSFGDLLLLLCDLLGFNVVGGLGNC